MYRPLAVIISTPLTLIYQIEMALGTIFNAILLYIIHKHTPPKMKSYRLILLNMTASQLLSVQSGLGCIPEYLYPLPALRINGYFQLIGTTYGGRFSVIFLVFFYMCSGLYVAECSLFRYYTLSNRRYRLRRGTYYLIHGVLAVLTLVLGIYISTHFLQNGQGLLDYAKDHNYPTGNIDIQNDVLAVANIESSLFLPIFISMIVLLFSVTLFIYILNLLTHQLLKNYFTIIHLSSIHYQQQKSLTYLLLGQGSLPLFIPLLVILIVAPTFVDFLDGKLPSKLVWELCVCTAVLYPLLSPILTIAFTKPYLISFISILKTITFTRRRETSVSVIKI